MVNKLEGNEIIDNVEKFIGNEPNNGIYLPNKVSDTMKDSGFNTCALSSIINYAKFLKSKNESLNCLSELFRLMLFNSIITDTIDKYKDKYEVHYMDGDTDIKSEKYSSYKNSFLVFELNNGKENKNDVLGAYTKEGVVGEYYNFLKRSKIIINGEQYSANNTGISVNHVVKKDDESKNDKEYNHVKDNIYHYAFVLKNMVFWNKYEEINYYFIPTKVNTEDMVETIKEFRTCLDNINESEESEKINSLKDFFENLCHISDFTVAIKRTDGSQYHKISDFYEIFYNQKAIKILLKLYLDFKFNRCYKNYLKMVFSDKEENQKEFFKQEVINHFFNEHHIEIKDIIKQGAKIIEKEQKKINENVRHLIEAVEYFRRINYLIDFCKNQDSCNYNEDFLDYINNFNGKLKEMTEENKNNMKEKIQNDYKNDAMNEEEKEMIDNFAIDISNRFGSYFDMDLKDNERFIDGFMFGRCIKEIENICEDLNLGNTIGIRSFSSSIKNGNYLKNFMKSICDLVKKIENNSKYSKKEGCGIRANKCFVSCSSLASTYEKKSKELCDFLIYADLAFCADYNSINNNDN